MIWEARWFEGVVLPGRSLLICSKGRCCSLWWSIASRSRGWKRLESGQSWWWLPGQTNYSVSKDRLLLSRAWTFGKLAAIWLYSVFACKSCNAPSAFKVCALHTRWQVQWRYQYELFPSWLQPIRRQSFRWWRPKIHSAWSVLQARRGGRWCS